jgi:hypothetical protein
MKRIQILIMFASGILYIPNLTAQEYDEEKTRAQLKKYLDNPKLYYDKLKTLSDKVDAANKNTIKVSEEYMELLNQKDSVIGIYKNQLAKAKKASSSNTASAASAPSSLSIASAPPASTPSKTASPAAQTPYRVQLAAFTREDFAQYFKDATKLLGITKLSNRNVVEVSGFNNPEEAQQFSQNMRRIGFPGAFVSKYENGERVEGYTAAAGLTPTNAKTPPTIKTPSIGLSYPNYVPFGYRELVGVKTSIPAESKVNEAPNPNIPKPSQAAKSAPVKKAPSGYIQSPDGDKTKLQMKDGIISAKPIASSDKAPTSINSKADKLDAAFEQLLNKK